MYDKLGRFIAAHPGPVVAAWGGVFVLLAALAPRWEDSVPADDVHLLPDRCLSVRGYDWLKQAFPEEAFGSKVIFVFDRPEQRLSASDLSFVGRVAQSLEELRTQRPDLRLGPIASCRDALVGQRYVSTDGRCTILSVALPTPFLSDHTTASVVELEKLVRQWTSAYLIGEGAGTGPFQLFTTGPAGIGRDLNDAVYSSLDTTTWATLGLVVVILLLVYRSPVMALVPLVTVGTSVFISVKTLAVLAVTFDLPLVNITKIFVVVVLFGAGTDYCLFLISRYREELHGGCTWGEAVHGALRQVGGALTASAGTVVIGLGMMGLAEFAKMRWVGPSIAVSLVVALAASLTLAPAILRLAGRWAFWPGPDPARSAASFPVSPPSSRFWDWASATVARYPARIWLTSVLLLLPLALVGMCTQSVFNICAELSPQSQSRRGLEVIQRRFTAGEIGPLTVLVRSTEDWNSEAKRAELAALTGALLSLDNVAEVRSLTSPLGKPLEPGKSSGLGLDRLLARPADWLLAQGARAYYVAHTPQGSITRLDVVFRTEPFAQESVRCLEVLRQRLDELLTPDRKGERSYAMYGITALTHDLAVVHDTDRRLVNGLVLLGILMILLAVVRRPITSVYLLLSVLFSYYVTIGATELACRFLIGTPAWLVDWKVPYFLFVILVAIGEDYNIFLMTRVQEEAGKGGWAKGIERALSRTGATISCCGLIMAGTFATMGLSSLVTLAQLGLALAFGVLLDTFVVRPILVPAFLLMLHRGCCRRTSLLPQPVGPSQSCRAA